MYIAEAAADTAVVELAVDIVVVAVGLAAAEDVDNTAVLAAAVEPVEAAEAVEIETVVAVAEAAVVGVETEAQAEAESPVAGIHL